MATQSQHTEPKGRHSYDELMHPGRGHHNQTAQPCPDPSVHKDSKLQEQASTAALYVTKSKDTDSNQSVLDANNKLSSRSAAMSLKYATPQDLPSFPVVGINTTDSANSAANLAKDYKMAPLWQPDASATAGKAAMLAKDYKMAPLWQPGLSTAGSKAALLAHNHGGKLDLWMPEASAEGNSAANLAMRNKGLSPQLDYGYTADGRSKALMAATGALGRSRAGSTPTTALPVYPDAANSASNALNAATVAHKPSVRDSNRLGSAAMEAARVQNTKGVSRDMYTEHPPVAIEVAEQKYNAAMRASSVSMAKQMYDYQKRKDEEAAGGATAMGATAAVASHNRTSSSSSTPDVRQQAMQYIHLQEAAQKLANERLAKMDPDANARFRSYYGYETETQRNRLSVRGRQRKRADSDGQSVNSDDEFQAHRVRSQMTQFNRDIAEVDAKKRATDRANLLAAAERKVQASMHTMDEKVFAETGKVSPAMMEEWEAKARAKAAKDSEARMANHGKVSIGGGKFLDMSEIEAIAAARLKPTLDQITETAEKRRAHDEEVRLELEEQKRQAMNEKERQKQLKADQQRQKNEEQAVARTKRAEEKAVADKEKAALKQKRNEEKAVLRAQKDAEKTRKADEKRVALAERQKTKDVKKDTEVVAVVGTATGTEAGAVVVADVEADHRSPPPAFSEVEDSSEGEDEDDIVSPLERQVSPTSIRPANDQGALHPNLERHVSHIGDSDDDLSDDDSDVFSEPAAVAIAAPETSSHANIVVLTRSDTSATIPQASTTLQQTEATLPETRSTLVETLPEATTTLPETSTTAEVGPFDEAVTEPITSLPVESGKIGTNEIGTDTTPQIASLQPTTSRSTAPNSQSTMLTKSPKQPSESKGFRGLFGKLKRNSKTPAAADEKKSSGTLKKSAPIAVSSHVPTATTTVPDVDIPAGAGIAVEDPVSAASPSSFRRGETDLHSISSLSSDDGVAVRGRVLRKAAADSDDEEEGEFEEARDTFETAAPAPNFAGLPRSLSPSRGAKFHEEV